MLQMRSIVRHHPIYNRYIRTTTYGINVYCDYSHQLSKHNTLRQYSTKIPTTSIEIQERVQNLFDETLTPLNDRLLGPLPPKNSDTMTPLPFVFILGNHSSGKSSFINYILKRDVQKAGVAPTDDGFTIIAPGTLDTDQDGPALIGDPDFGFAGLRPFGTGLMNHVNLKVRSGLELSDIMLVDSPGMIDSPATQGLSASQLLGLSPTDTSHDRGYDFHKVTRWFAERADVILLFFDPDKPGTTGETLTALTRSLAGMDHKLHIVFNKVDQFDKVQDFARAYGALCWNLSKVIHRKDLPRIYTMCLPLRDHGSYSDPAKLILEDLKRAREDIVNEVLKAPSRRIDNTITRLYDSTRLIKVHAKTMTEVRRIYRRLMIQRWALLSVIGVTGPSLAVGAVSIGLPPSITAVLTGISIISAGSFHYFNGKQLEEKVDMLMSDEGLNRIFDRVHALELSDNDEFVLSLWHRVRPQLQIAVETIGIGSIDKVSNKELASIEHIIHQEVPRLRRLTAALTKVAGRN